jgi:hypothetical protein
MAILNKLKNSREAITDPQTFAALVYKSGNRPGHSLGRSFLVVFLFKKSIRPRRATEQKPTLPSWPCFEMAISG